MEFFSSPPRPDRFWGPPTLLCNVFPRIKRPGREVYHSPPSSAEVKNAPPPQHIFMSLWLFEQTSRQIHVLRRSFIRCHNPEDHDLTLHRRENLQVPYMEGNTARAYPYLFTTRCLTQNTTTLHKHWMTNPTAPSGLQRLIATRPCFYVTRRFTKPSTWPYPKPAQSSPQLQTQFPSNPEINEKPNIKSSLVVQAPADLTYGERKYPLDSGEQVPLSGIEPQLCSM
jgi:hypothetical protein